MINQLTDNIHSNLYLQAALNLGFEVRAVADRQSLFKISRGSKAVTCFDGAIAVNPNAWAVVLHNKHLVNGLLSRAGIPVPRNVLCKTDMSRADIEDKVKEMFPLVVKPVSGKNGEGVTANIRTVEEFNAAIDVIRTLRRQQFLVEEFVPGQHYRILMHRGEVLDVLHRLPAYVTGDGRRTIGELVATKNQRRKDYHDGMKSICLGDDLTAHLALAGKTLQSVPVRGERVVLRNVCNFAKGGEVERIPLHRVHTDTMLLFEKIQKLVGLELCGIDFICADIESHYEEGPCGVNEVNSAPGMDIHCFADTDQIRVDVPATILERHFAVDN